MTIRPATDHDAASIAAIYEPFVRDTATSFEIEPPDAAEMQRRMTEHGERYPWLVDDEDNKIRAYAYATPFRARHAYQWNVEVSVYVAPTFHRLGVGRSLYRELFRQLGDIGYVNAYAGITLPNAASVALHAALGFESIGVYRRVGFKNGAWHDVGWWSLRLRETDDPTADAG